jgi:hypothetical protein
MDTKRVLIIGAVGVLGVGAYLYFRPKNTKGVDASLLENASSGISVPPKGTVLSTPQEVADTAKKIADAKGLAVKIQDLRNKKTKIGGLLATRALKAKVFDQQIADIEKVLNSLGYTELNGNVVKIV